MSELSPTNAEDPAYRNRSYPSPADLAEWEHAALGDHRRLKAETPALNKELILEMLRARHFLDPRGANVDAMTNLMSEALNGLITHQGDHPLYRRHAERRTPPDIAANYQIPQQPAATPLDTLRQLHRALGDSVRGGHPLMVKNIIPAPAMAALAAFSAVATLQGNAVTEEDAGDGLLSEIACVAGLSRLIGIDPERSGGVFTFGGTATNLYGIKIGLAKALPEHRCSGTRGQAVVVGSQLSHYGHAVCADWLGLGSDNHLKARSLPDQTVDLAEMEELCRRAIEAGKVIACILVNAGTTSCLGIDDLGGACALAERLQKEYQLPYKPHVHADSVLGWAFEAFREYDFEHNPLGFTDPAIRVIRRIVTKLDGLSKVDSFGVDFHKLGYLAYTSSIFIARERSDLERLGRSSKDVAPLFNSTSAYNPGLFTLETSRSTATIVATRVALETIGVEGYQALLGNIIENGITIRKGFDQRSSHGLIAINSNSDAPDSAIRAYPPGVDPLLALAEEMTAERAIAHYEDYFTRFASWVDQHYSRREGGVPMTRSKAAIFNRCGLPLGGLRIYPVSPYMTTHDAQAIVDFVIAAKAEFDAISIAPSTENNHHPGYDAH